MYVVRATSRGCSVTRNCLDGVTTLRLQSTARYSTAGRRRRSPAANAVMFKKAVKDHSATAAKPLQSNLLQSNAAPAPQSKPPLPQSTGVKRKIEMTSSGQAGLSSLHSAVYYDENDFDDDDDLDFSDVEPAVPLTKNTAPTPDTEPAKLPDLPEPKEVEEVSPDVRYPDLPPVPSAEEAPSSSVQLPWSSSPPSHFKKPSNPRTIPWLKNQTQNHHHHHHHQPRPESRWPEAAEKKPEPKPETKPVTPARSKNIVPWMKSESAIKQEQKELRRQNKKEQMPEPAKPGQVSGKSSFFLSDEQKHVLDAVVKNGKSIFFTGSAGTGKSVLMREIIKQLRNKYRREQDRVAITASTGLAACNIGGVTLHSFAGIGLGKEEVPELVKKVRRNQKARARWLRTKVLVVDEVSMVDGDLFDKLEDLARRIRNNGRPFGGIQLVVTGDFFQLPPVPEGSNREARFAFSASTWNTSIQHTILLTYVFRQRDPEFARMLNEMRLGKLSPSTIDSFRQLSRPLNFEDSLEATELFPTRYEVENANGVRMGRLSGDLMTFNAVDSGTIQDVQIREKLLSNCMAPPAIHLKKGAQVMLIKNMEESLVNGSIGRVVAFMDEATYDYYTDHEGEFGAPEGQGDQEVEEGIRARKKIKSHANKEGAVIASRKWPLVCFPQPDGTERHLLCQPETWKIELPNGEVQAQRQQVPLILAWALSIHKAQGQTLPRVKVDLGRVFEKGQAYVALSRATTQAGLQVTRFDARKVMVHPKVIEFYSKLVSITDVLQTEKPAAGRQTSLTEYEDGLDEQDYLEQMHG